MNLKDTNGVFVALATPLQADGSLNRSALPPIVEFLIDKGVSGIFAASTVGEFVHLPAAQRYDLVAATVDCARGRIPILAGASDISPLRVIEHCREFRRSGAAAAVIAPPYYYAMGQDDIVAHYRCVAESVDLPFVLYHIPQCSNRMTAKTMLSIAEKCSPAGLKNSNPDVIEMMTLIRELGPGGIPYFVGPDELILTGLQLGAAGCMSGLPGVVPEAVVGMVDAFRAGDYGRATRIQYRFSELLQMIQDLPFPASYKLMMSIRGFEVGNPANAQSERTRRVAEERRPTIAAKIEEILATDL